MLMRKALKAMATVSLVFILFILTMSMVSVFRIAPEIRIEPWEVEISTPWELQQGSAELTSLKEAEVPEWYRSHGELTPAEAKALEEYKSEYPNQELGENPIPCTVNGVKGILTEKQGHIYIYYGPVRKKMT